MREERDLISDFRPEGWLDWCITPMIRMVYHTNEAKWGGDVVPESYMVGIKQNDSNKTPANSDCIKYLY